MMARSTPRVLFQSSVVKHSVTALEVFAFLHAFAMLALLFALHVRFVRHDGCAGLLLADANDPADSSARGAGSVPDRLRHASVIELTVAGRDPSAAARPPRFRFARERGFLLLSDSSLSRLNVTVAPVALRPDAACLGGVVLQRVLADVVGYETVAVNAFARLGRRLRAPGYVLSVSSRRVVNLGHADYGSALDYVRSGTVSESVSRISLRLLCKFGAVLTAVFIMCTTAALVAFTLNEVQRRMIKLTLDLQFVMRSQTGYGPVVLRYALDALVFVPIVAGMLFFLFEFFDDQALAFAVLIIAWLCEFAASGSTRHWFSRLCLPRLFFCYFGGFHLYFFSFPLGFSWLSLGTSISFMLHAALTVWNHCELPLLRRDRNVRAA